MKAVDEPDDILHFRIENFLTVITFPSFSLLNSRRLLIGLVGLWTSWTQFENTSCPLKVRSCFRAVDYVQT